MLKYGMREGSRLIRRWIGVASIPLGRISVRTVSLLENFKHGFVAYNARSLFANIPYRIIPLGFPVTSIIVRRIR